MENSITYENIAYTAPTGSVNGYTNIIFVPECPVSFPTSKTNKNPFSTLCNENFKSLTGLK